MRFIGDVHGESNKYLNLIKGQDYSFQVGDLGFDYKFLDGVDPERHKFIGGNHDNYDEIGSVPHNLGDSGVWSVPQFGDIFYVRGAFSIDHQHRVGHDIVVHDRVIRRKDFWVEEELTYKEGEAAMQQYQAIKPDFVVSHACPASITPFVGNLGLTRSFGYPDVIPTLTSNLLEAMWNFHKPKMWIFGHFHKRFDKILDGTRFVCLDILDYLDLEPN